MARVAFSWAVVVAVAVGCAEKYDAKLEGQITFADGKPLTGGGQLVFLPVNGGPPAVGYVDGAGRYFAYMLRPNPPDGLPPGEYHVGVICDGGDSGGKNGPVSVRYMDPKKSGLTISVQPGHNKQDLKVERARTGGG